MGDKYPSKTSKTPQPPPSMTYAQQIEWDKRHPKENQPFGYSFYKNPWYASAATGIFALLAGGPQKAKRDEEMRKLAEKREKEKAIKIREERLRKSKAAAENLRRIQAQAKEDREEQERTDKYYKELDRKNKLEEGRADVR
tara:strand:+ start:129 stop:551 length:423 start_codon:yes stop_codon:yes gene_type:complete